MNRRWMRGVVLAGVLVALASVVWAGKAEVEKQAKETKVTLSLKDVAPAAALDMIAMMGEVKITVTDVPPDAAKVTLDLKDVSVLDAVKRVATISGLAYAIVDDGIEVSGKKKD